MQFVYLERVECHWSLRVHLQAGSRVPAHCTSGGKVMLAHLDERARKTLFRNVKPKAFTPHTITDTDALESELAAIQERGYAVNDQEFTVGVVGVAVPIRSRQGRLLAALALHGPSPRLDIERAIGLVPRLKQAATLLARAWEEGVSSREAAAAR
jgi:DNA-binding IclR family transcriptional regulator